MAKDWRGALEKTARLAGIGKNDFDACLANKAMEDQVAQSRLIATTQLGVELDPDLLHQRHQVPGRADRAGVRTGAVRPGARNHDAAQPRNEPECS